MLAQGKKNIRLISGVVLSAMLIITGVLLMSACVNIYNIGDRPFTPENISAAFAKISVPVWLTVGAVIVGGVITLIIPAEKKKPRAIKDKRITLSLLMNKLNTEACSEEALMKIEKERRLCKILRICALLLCIASALPALIYSLNFAHFGADYNGSVILAFIWILPCTLIAMGICIAQVYLENASIERQLATAKAALAEAQGNFSASVSKERPTDEKIITGIRIAVAAVALIFVVAGILNGGMVDVLAKAVNICTECIGLG